MKLNIFKSSHGDCLLLQTDGHNILCDGGMAKSMRNHVRAPMAQMVADNGGALDAIYVSHIDQDHISGVLQLLKDAVDWAVFDFHDANGNPPREPKSPRPPQIKALWHNSFRDQIGDNVAEIGDLLAAAVPILNATGLHAFMHEAHELQNVAASIPEALKVSRYAKPDFLNIPVNRLPGTNGPARLLYRKPTGTKSFAMGDMKITIVGPSRQALADLRDGWNTWLGSEKGQRGLERVNREIRGQLEKFATGDFDGSPFDLSSWNGISGFKGVTPPNIASLVLMVEQNGKRILLTGDAQQDLLLEDLEACGFMPDGHLHVDVLKVQHHGSDHNTDANFARKVSADHYIFCGDGGNGNPEDAVLKFYYNARLGPGTVRALSPLADGRDFTFWFSTVSTDLRAGSSKRKSFEGTEKLVAELIDKSDGKLNAHFAGDDPLTLTL